MLIATTRQLYYSLPEVAKFKAEVHAGCIPFLRMSKKGPEQTAQEIGEYLQANEPSVAAFNVIKGFLNLTIASSAWIELLNGIHADKQYGIVAVTDNSPLVMIEYSSPNTNKPLHLGHVRNNLLGNALANIVAANGNKVVKTNIVNEGRSLDWRLLCFLRQAL